MGMAADFMRDNTNGGLVVKAVCRKNGSIRYQMEEGHSYLLKERDLDVLSRYHFKPRFKTEQPK
jgi:hypothetical protein